MTDETEAATAVLDHYAVDARASRFTVQAFATGILSAVGHNPRIGIRDFNGEVNFNPQALQASEFRMSIRLASLSVLDDISSNDRREIEALMKDRVLEIANWPEAVYEASVVPVTTLGDSLCSAALDGKLTFHGVTRSQPVSARIAVFGEMLRVSGDFTLKQSDYHIQPISVAGGTLKVKDELKFSFEMVARKQE